MESIDVFKSFHSIWQELSTSCTAVTNHWHHFHYRHVQPSTWLLGIRATAVRHLVWAHIRKRNVVADAISRPRTLGLYQDNGNTDLAKTDHAIVDNIMEEVHDTEWIPNLATYKMEKLKLDILREAQWQNAFCTKKTKSIRSKKVDGFVLDKNGILCKNLLS